MRYAIANLTAGHVAVVDKTDGTCETLTARSVRAGLSTMRAFEHADGYDIADDGSFTLQGRPQDGRVFAEIPGDVRKSWADAIDWARVQQAAEDAAYDAACKEIEDREGF